MPAKLSTTVNKIEKVPNKRNSELIREFHQFMISNGSSERHQNNNLKAVITFSLHLGTGVNFCDITSSKEILSFLNTKIKSKEEDPDQKWITTWNDYMHRIKHFFRWMHNSSSKDEPVSMEDWKTASFLQIKEKRSKRISPYLETELWEKDDILLITRYELYKRNKAILALLWDLNARNHETTLLRIKHVQMLAI